MRRLTASLGMGVFALCCAFGQGPAPTPTPAAFDVASVRPSHIGKGGANLAVTPGMLTIRNLPLRAIIASAYGIADYQISGPKWIEQERFDILAKTDPAKTDFAKSDSAATVKDEMLPLLRPLLAERFQLAMHRETKQLPAYVLTVGTSGAKLEAADPAATDLPSKKANKSGGASTRSEHMTMPQFVEILSRRLGRPVEDSTGLAGVYRVRLEWAAENQDHKVARPDSRPGKTGKAEADTDRPSIFTALHDQMGLRLQARKAQVELFVIDHIEKLPTEN